MTNKRLIVMLFLLGLAIAVRADEVILLEGKIVKGTITHEDDQEVMIRVNGNMFLRIEKSKIKEIIRPKAGAPARSIVTLDSIMKSTEAVPVIKQTGAAPVIKEIKPDTIFVKQESNGVTLLLTQTRKTYNVQSATFVGIEEEIFNRDTGKGFSAKGGRAASETNLVSSWGGVLQKLKGNMKWSAVVIQATVTITVPRWDAGKQVENADIQNWNEFLSELEEHDQGHADIYKKGLMSLGQALLNAREVSESKLKEESNGIYKTWQERTENQQAGHDRRLKEKKEKPVKKK